MISKFVIVHLFRFQNWRNKQGLSNRAEQIEMLKNIFIAMEKSNIIQILNEI